MAKIVTITNPLTGQPAQVDQLDHTAQQIDDAVEAARWSHRNLLDNAYWASPDAIIDQRGGYVVPPGTAYYSDTGLTTQAGAVSAYTKVAKVNSTYGTITVSGTTYYVVWSAAVRGYVGAGYGIDRWIADQLTIVPGGVCVPPNSYFRTLFNFDTSNKTFTMSVLTADNVLSEYTFKTGSNEFYYNIIVNGIRLELFSNPGGNSYFMAYPTEEMKVFKAAKIELGSHQTLAHQENGVWVLNEIPDYGEQLTRCQRYYYDSRFGRTANPNGAYAVRLDAASSHLVGSYRFPVTMRTKPSVKIYSFNGTENCISYWASGADVSGVTASANEAAVGLTGFNSVTMSSEVAANIYAFHIVANAEL